MRRRKENQLGIAIFIVLTSLMLLSFALKELFQLTNTQAEKVRYQYDYLQATYMARSAQNFSRFLIILDDQISKQLGGGAKSTDSLSDIWTTPFMLPIPAKYLQALTGQTPGGADNAGSQASDDEAASASETQDFAKKCEDFFSDFPGNAASQVEDLNRRINLNDLDDAEVFQTLVELLSSNTEILDMLTAKNITPTNLVREIRDYMDQNDKEDETNSPEDSVYRTLELDYGPKNYNFTNLDELKMVPSVDDEIFDFLSRFVSAVHIAQRKKPAKINLNTVNKDVFQALLKGVSEPGRVTEEFFKDREENKTLYSEGDAAKKLEELFGLDAEEFRLKLASGASDAFQINTTATVNDVEVRLETVVGRGYKKPIDPYSIMRLAP